MSYQIIVQELGRDNATGIERYRQIVDDLNIRALVELVNPKPKRIRTTVAKRTEAK